MAQLIKNHKAWVVAKGYIQLFSVDYNETFVLATQLDIIRALITLVAQKNRGYSD